MPAERPYVLGTHDVEARRLGLQHRLWSATAHALWNRAGFGPGARLLDVGAGPGFASFDLAQIADGVRPDDVLLGSRGRVVAIDESARFVAQIVAGAAARGLPIRALQGDVQELSAVLARAGEPAGFDGAWIRWVLCFVPDPEAVIAGIAANLRPGGRLVIHDYFNYEAMTLAPRGPAFTRVVQAVAASFRARGGDPDIMGRVPAILARHGLHLLHLEVDQRIVRPTEPLWAWPDSFFRNYVPALVEAGFLTRSEGEAWREEWDDHIVRNDGFALMPTVLGAVAERG